MASLPDRIENFIAWLNQEIQDRHLTDAELAKRGGISPSVISSARAGKLPGWSACVGIARGLNLPPELVFRAAGHLPPLPEPDSQLLELIYLFPKATPATRNQIIDFLRFLIEREKKS